MKGPTVKDFSVEKLVPAIPGQYKHLLPTVLTQEKCSFVIAGCSNAVANAIRRTIACELKVAHLTCKYEDIETDDPHIIPEMIQKRLRMIPLHQKTRADAVFSLFATNSTLSALDVKTGLIKNKNGAEKTAFDETFTLLTINPGRYLRINNIVVAHEYGYVPEFGMCALAFNTTSVCQDVVPINTYIPNHDGVRSQMADPRVWKLGFVTNGTLPSADIVRAGCKAIIERLKTVLSLLYTIVSSENQYTLTIEGDSDTIGNLLVKTIDEMYPDVEAATYSVPAAGRSVIIKIIYGDDINTMYKSVVEKLVGAFESILDQIRA